MTLTEQLDRVHAAVTGHRQMRIFTAFTRVLLALGFIPPSIPKILHIPFTTLPSSHPVGDFFGALYRTGFYYDFIGWSQLLAATLMLFPRTAHFGALLFLPIIVNITVLTFSVGFKGTVYITALMLLAALYLVAWEYDRLRPILFADRVSPIPPANRLFFLLPLSGAVGGAAAASLFITLRLANLNRWPVPVLIGLTAAGLAFGFACAVHHRFMRVGPLNQPEESLSKFPPGPSARQVQGA